MNRDELANLPSKGVALITAASLVNQKPRTLLFGYNCERHTWHVYLGEDQKIHLVVHTRSLLLHATDKFAINGEYLPNKRLYPESCDAEFATLLCRAGEGLPFTTFTDGAHEARTKDRLYAGLTLDELEPLRSKNLTSEDLPGECSSILAELVLTQAAIEIGATHDEAQRGISVPLNRADELLLRATGLLNSLRRRGVYTPRPAQRYVEDAIASLGAGAGVGSYVLTASLNSGLLFGNIRVSHKAFLEETSLKKNGFQVESFGRGVCIRKDTNEVLPGEPYLAVLVPMPVQRSESVPLQGRAPELEAYCYLQCFIGSEESFFKQANGYAGLPLNWD